MGKRFSHAINGLTPQNCIPVRLATGQSGRNQPEKDDRYPYAERQQQPRIPSSGEFLPGNPYKGKESYRKNIDKDNGAFRKNTATDS